MIDDPKELAELAADETAMYYKRREALKKLFKADPQAARPLLDRISSDKEKVLRRDAAEMLGAFSDSGAAAMMIRALADEDADVRRNSVRSLKRVAPKEALEALRGLASSDPSIFVRRDAEEAIKAIETAAGGGAAPLSPSPAAAQKPASRPEPASALAAPSTPPWSAPSRAPAEALQPRPAEKRESPPWKQGPALPEPAASTPPARPAAPAWSPPRKASAATPPAKPAEKPDLPPWKRDQPAPEPVVSKPPASPAAPPVKARPPDSVFDKLKARQMPDPARAAEQTPPWKRPGFERAPILAPAIDSIPTVAPSQPQPAAEQRERANEPLPAMTRKLRKKVAEQTEGAILCPKCQWVLKPGQRFCTFCGHPVEPASARAGFTPAPPQNSIPTAKIVDSRLPGPRRPAPALVPQAPLKGTNTGCAVAAIAIGAVVFLGIIVAAATSDKPKPAATAPRARPAAVRTTQAKATQTQQNRPTAQGRPVVIEMKNGKTVYALLLADNDSFYRVKVKDGIYNIPKNDVNRVLARKASGE